MSVPTPQSSGVSYGKNETTTPVEDIERPEDGLEGQDDKVTEEEKKPLWRKIFNFVTGVVVAIFLLVAIFTSALPFYLGAVPRVILSSSMDTGVTVTDSISKLATTGRWEKPGILPGDVVISEVIGGLDMRWPWEKQEKPRSYSTETLTPKMWEELDAIEVGDIIVFQPEANNGKKYFTHRVIEKTGSVQDKTLGFVTQGDAKGIAVDEPIDAVQVRATYMYHVPYIGKLIMLRDDYGVLFIAAAGLLIIGGILPVIFPKKKRVEETEDVEDTDAEGKNVENTDAELKAEPIDNGAEYQI